MPQVDELKRVSEAHDSLGEAKLKLGLLEVDRNRLKEQLDGLDQQVALAKVARTQAQKEVDHAHAEARRVVSDARKGKRLTALEKRIGRPVQLDDIDDAPINIPIHYFRERNSGGINDD